MPLPEGCGVGLGVGACALTHTIVVRVQSRAAAKRQRLFAGDIDLKTFQQGTFGPGEILKIRVADETPAAKNCGVKAKTASKI